MSETVVKHNNLIDAKFRTPSLTKAHGRILAYLIAQVHSRNDEDFKYVEITPDEYKKLTGNTQYDISQVKWDLGDLTDLSCMVETDKKFIFCHLVDYAEVDKETGLVKMRLGEEMKPYLLNLHRNYTLLDLQEFLSLKSKHSQRLYEVFQKEKNQKDFVTLQYTLEEIKEMLGLVDFKKKGKELTHKYPKWADFERRVLIPAREELCELAILFEYEPVIKGRKTVGVKLYFNPTSACLEEEGGEDYLLLKNTSIKAIYKIDISRCRSRGVIGKALSESTKKGDHAYKDLIKLVPKTRPERVRLMAQKLRNEKSREKVKTNGDIQLEL